MQTITLVTAIAGLVLGVVGAVLGIMNTWRAVDRVRLKARPVWYLRSDGIQTVHIVSIEVTNLSFFPVTVSAVGFALSDGRLFVFIPALPSRACLPQCMESGTSITVVAPPGIPHNPAMKQVVRAYAKTACDRVFTGDSPALRGVVNEARSSGMKVEGTNLAG